MSANSDNSKEEWDDLRTLVRSYQNPDARQHLLELARRLTKIGYWIYDLGEEKIHWSDELYEIAGVDRDSFVLTLKSAVHAYHPDDREIVVACAEEAWRTGEDFEYEVRVLRPSGEIRHVACLGTCEVDENGEVQGLFAAFQDITERKSIHGRLMRTQHLASIGSVATGIAHGVNNPLTSLFVNLELALEELEYLGEEDFDPAMLRDAIVQARGGAEKVRQVVRGLKTFAREERSQAAPTDFRNVVEVALAITQNELRHRAQLILEYNPAPSVSAVRSRLEQVLVGLLMHAADRVRTLSLEQARVELRVDTDESGNALLELSYNVPDESQEALDQALMSFEPQHDTRAGTGLGLAVCHAIVHEDGGSLTAEAGPEQTTFRIRFPSVDGRGFEFDSEVSDTESTNSTRARVLVVDDEEIVGSSVARILPNNDVTIALSGEEALKVFEREGEDHFDIILCDMMMPGMSGEDLFYILQERFPVAAERVIFVTGGVFTEEASSFLARRPQGWLAKPYDVSKIRSLVAKSAQPRS